MIRKQNVRIGDLLVGKGEITEDQLKEALAAQKQSGQKLGRVLIEKGFVDEDRFLGFLSEQFEIPFINLREFSADPEVVARLPETYARRYRAVVLRDDGGELLVGMVDPMDIFAYDELSRQLQASRSALAVVRESELLVPCWTCAYRRTDDIVRTSPRSFDGEISPPSSSR